MYKNSLSDFFVSAWAHVSTNIFMGKLSAIQRVFLPSYEKRACLTSRLSGYHLFRIS